MTAWQKPYLTAWIDAIAPHGDVLQIGFGNGHVASQIQKHNPKSHTIVEGDPKTSGEAKAWAAQFPHVSIIADRWQTAFSFLGIFDTILLDDCSLVDPETIARRHEEAHKALHRGKELASMVEKELPNLMRIHYSDADIDDFFQQVGSTSRQEASRFMHELKSRGQISQEQYARALHKHSLEACEDRMPAPKGDPLFNLLQKCLKDHMRAGSCLSSISADTLSRYENPSFFEHVITNPQLDFREERLVLDPSHETLLIFIKKHA